MPQAISPSIANYVCYAVVHSSAQVALHQFLCHGLEDLGAQPWLLSTENPHCTGLGPDRVLHRAQALQSFEAIIILYHRD